MVLRTQDTIYMLGPILTFLVLLSYMLTPLIDNIERINIKLVAFSECSNKMIDYAFMGQVFNFSECYLSTVNNITLPNCTYYEDRIICEYNGRTYEYIISNITS